MNGISNLKIRSSETQITAKQLLGVRVTVNKLVFGAMQPGTVYVFIDFLVGIKDG